MKNVKIIFAFAFFSLTIGLNQAYAQHDHDPPDHSSHEHAEHEHAEHETPSHERIEHETPSHERTEHETPSHERTDTAPSREPAIHHEPDLHRAKS